MTYHPIQVALDRIWNEGHTPKIVVDSTHKDVVVPEFIRVKWKDRLLIELCASYPLNLDYSETGLTVDLAFSGSVCRCTFPWARIHVVIDSDTGETETQRLLTGIAPLDTLLEAGYSSKTETQPPATPARWVPRVIKGGKS